MGQTEIYNPKLHNRAMQSMKARSDKLQRKCDITAGREYASRKRQLETTEYIINILEKLNEKGYVKIQD